jgi:hypothetical protein
MNIKQKNKKQLRDIIGFTTHSPYFQGFLCILKVFEGLVMEAEKQKIKRETA